MISSGNKHLQLEAYESDYPEFSSGRVPTGAGMVGGRASGSALVANHSSHSLTTSVNPHRLTISSTDGSSSA